MSELSSPSTSRPTSPEPANPKNYRFQYAESVVSFGPDSVAGDGADYFMGSRLDLGAYSNEWTSVRDGFNAISTVLNSPHKKQAPPKAHSSLPTYPAVQLPRVRRRDFDGYLASIGPEYDRFVKNLQDVQDDHPAQPQLPELDVVPKVFFEPDFDLTKPHTFSAVTSLLSGEVVDPTSVGHSLPLIDALSAYADTVEAHLTHEISVRSTSFFAALSNLNQLQTSSTETLERIRLLRESLTQVDDGQAKVGLKAVAQEVKLSRISSVLTGVSGVQTAVDRIGLMRGLADDGKWDQALQALEEVEKMWDHSSIELKLPAKKGHSLSVTSRPSIPVPLSELSAFSLLPNHLKALTLQIVQALSTETALWLKRDLEKRMYEDPSTLASLQESLSPLCRALLKTKGVKDAVLRWRQTVLAEVVRGVVERHIPDLQLDSQEPTSPKSEEARANFKNLPHASFLQLLRDMYKVLLGLLETLSSQNKALFLIIEDEAGKPGAMPPPSSLRSPKPPTIASPTPRSASLQPPPSPLLPPSSPRVTSPSSPRLGSPIIPLPQSMSPHLNPPSPMLGPSQLSPSSNLLSNVQEELSDLLATAAELTHTLSSKLLQLHPSFSSSPTQKLPLPSFVKTFTTSWSFILSCEILSGKMIVGLRGVLVGMAKQYLSTLHQGNLNFMAKAVEDELWNPVTNVDDAIQKDVVEVLLECAMKDAEVLKVRDDNSDEISEPTSPKVIEPPSRPATNGTSASRRHLHIETSSFFLVPCTQHLLSTLITTYVALIINIPLLAIDTMSRVIEFLKMFNGRVCQVVLGAGAMKSAGLKNITAKHLALASQTLSILIVVIPYVREMFRRHLSPKQAIMLVEFDKLKRDYQEHQNEIHSKLIAIMGDRLSAHLKALQAVDWKAPAPPSGVNDYMIVLVKETTTLHKVLSRYLSGVVVEFVMSQVFAAINHRLSEEYSKIELPSEEAKQRLLGDARHLHAKLSELKGVGHVPTAMLEVVIQEKRIPRPPSTNAAPSPPRGPTPQPPSRTSTPKPQSQPQPQPPAPVSKSPPPQRSSTLNFSNTNARLKGLLSGHGLGRSNTLTASEKPLPSLADKSASGGHSGFRQAEGLNSPRLDSKEDPHVNGNGNSTGKGSIELTPQEENIAPLSPPNPNSEAASTPSLASPPPVVKAVYPVPELSVESEGAQGNQLGHEVDTVRAPNSVPMAES